MGKTIRIVLKGPPYDELRYYGKLIWDDDNVYIRHPKGGKDSWHKNGCTYLHTTDTYRKKEERILISKVSRELINYIEPCCEPPQFRGLLKEENDFVICTNDAGPNPRLAVEIVSNERCSGVISAWQTHSTAPSVITVEDKGHKQSLIIAVAGSLTNTPST